MNASRRRRISKRWRGVAAELYTTYGNDYVAIRAEIKRRYGSLVAILTIIEVILFIIKLWDSLGIQPTDEPTEQELEHIDIEEDEDGDD